MKDVRDRRDDDDREDDRNGDDRKGKGIVESFFGRHLI